MSAPAHSGGNPSSVDRPDPTAEHVYRHTAALLRRWAEARVDEDDDGSARRGHHLRSYLWRRLSDALDHPADISEPRGTDTADVVVEERVGVKVVSSLNQGASGWFHRELHTLCEGYDYLIVLGYGLDGEHTDLWRNLQTCLTSSNVDAEALTFVDTIEDDEVATESIRPQVAPETAALALLALPAVLVGVRAIATFALSLDSIGLGLLVAVGIVYLLGASLLGVVFGLL
jgi:hypothetical protein